MQNIKALHTFILQERDDAEKVIEAAKNIIERYQVVSVADIKELTGIDTVAIDHKWGWTSCNEWKVDQVPLGWELSMGNPTEIKLERVMFVIQEETQYRGYR